MRGDRVRRVTVTGSESTGKTSLARGLAQRFRTLWVPEFSRAYAMQKAAALDASDVEPIAHGQMRLEDEVLARASGVVILDTDLVSTVVYAEHYYGSCPPWVDDAARERLADLYLLCDIDAPWVADPVRDRPHARAEIHAAFTAQLERYGAPCVIIRGDWAMREASAVAAVELLSRK
ncbi:MAG TPA: ATP-binding protein [Gemmatimonadaceae bacterium]|nr:ATP-binding protein [Gemmatimonadaceae bacterium]